MDRYIYWIATQLQYQPSCRWNGGVGKLSRILLHMSNILTIIMSHVKTMKAANSHAKFSDGRQYPVFMLRSHLPNNATKDTFL